MSKILVAGLWSGILAMLLTSCASPYDADFNCKCAAVYGNYDSGADGINRVMDNPKVQKQLDADPALGAYYYQILGVCELYRGMIPEAMNAFDRSLAFDPQPMTYYFRAMHYLREGKNDEAAKDIAAMERLLNEGKTGKITYYMFLLGLRPGESHDELLKNCTDVEFAQSRLAALKRQLEFNRKCPPGKLPVMILVQSPRFDQIDYGMTLDDIKAKAGEPDESYKVRKVSMAGLKAYVYRLPQENLVVELRCSRDTGRLGDIIVLPLGSYQKQEGEGRMMFRPKDAPYTL